MDMNAIVAAANLAPSVHNTQPTLWRQDGDALELSLDPARLLAVGDPQGRDARLSLGAALEGTVIALSNQGWSVQGVELQAGPVVARLALARTAEAPDPDRGLMEQRITWRGGFAPVADCAPVASYCAGRADTHFIAKGAGLQTLAALNDAVSLKIMRDDAFRGELLQWMRLRPQHPQFALDGLNHLALGMSGFEARAAGIVLRRPVFGLLDAVGLGKAITAEAAKTNAAAGVVLFHRHAAEDPVVSGRAFYRMWLGLTRLGLAAWPMTALADDPDARATVSAMAGLPDARRLINCLRVGAIPGGTRPPARARLQTAGLILR